MCISSKSARTRLWSLRFIGLGTRSDMLIGQRTRGSSHRTVTYRALKLSWLKLQTQRHVAAGRCSCLYPTEKLVADVMTSSSVADKWAINLARSAWRQIDNALAIRESNADTDMRANRDHFKYGLTLPKVCTCYPYHIPQFLVPIKSNTSSSQRWHQPAAWVPRLLYSCMSQPEPGTAGSHFLSI